MFKNLINYLKFKPIKKFNSFETIDFLPNIWSRKIPIYAKKTKFPIKKSKIDYYEKYETTDMKK